MAVGIILLHYKPLKSCRLAEQKYKLINCIYLFREINIVNKPSRIYH